MTNKKQAVTTFVILAVILVIVSVFIVSIQQNNKHEELTRSQVARSLGFGEDVGYKDIEGNPVSFDEYLDKRILALAWASWCTSCADQLNILAEIADEESDVVILAFNRAEPVSTAVDFLEYYNLKSKVQLIMDSNDHFFTSINGYAMPETVFFDGTGNIRSHVRGAITMEQARQIVQPESQ